MQYTVPDYYDQFSCLGGACPDTCCAGWQIEVDSISLKRYLEYQKNQNGFGNRLINGIDWEEGVFCQDAVRRCEFLNEENLCDIYSEAGKEMLCLTCRTYPRHIEEFEGLREMSLCLSCPEAARIILMKEGAVSFIEREDEDEEEGFEEFDYFLHANLLTAREYLLEILQDKRIPIYQRMFKVVFVVDEIQECIDENKLFRCEEVIKKHWEIGFGENWQEEWQLVRETIYSSRYMKELWHPYRSVLEILNREWEESINECYSHLHQQENQTYKSIIEDFEQGCSFWEEDCEKLMVYWIYTYFCGAVYDENPWSKVRLTVMSTLLVRELSASRYISNGGRLSKEEFIKICIGYSRETEHSDQNLLFLEESDFVDCLAFCGQIS